MVPRAVAERIVAATGAAHIGRFARYVEILNYLSDLPRPMDWRALDDSRWEFPNGANLISCNPNTGFTEETATVLKQWLLDGAADCKR